MSASGSTRLCAWLPGFRSNELAHGYLPKGSDNGTMLAKAHAADGPYWNLRGNGGMLSTASDMHAFYKAVFESAALKAPAVRREIGKVLGLPNPEVDGPEKVAERPGGQPASAAMARVLTAMIEAMNSGHQEALRTFITEHFASEAGGPTVDERLQRIARMHENLGEITIEKIETFVEGPVEMRFRSAVQGIGTLKIVMNAVEPYRILGLQILIGG
jgi:hypothetical protein